MTALNGGSGKSTAPQTTGNRCYPSDSEAAATGGDGSGNGFYLGRKPRLLDLFCGAGGASVGYHRAGFSVVGVDLNPQPNYPYLMQEMDALDYLRRMLDRGWQSNFDAIHASPPCQRKSRMTNCRPGLAATYPDLIGPVRELLIQTGLPWVIENVEGSDLRDPVWLCGFMFGRQLYRHRGFETNWPLAQPEHPEHTIPASKAGHWKPGTIMSVAGHVAPVALAREVMEMAWTTREELAEAIPPYYSEHVGHQLIAAITSTSEAVA